MKYLKIVMLAWSVSILILADCTDKGYLDVNNDPNRVTDNNITPDLIFPQAAHATGAMLTGSISNEVSYLYDWVGYYAGTGDFALPGNQTTYDLDPPYVDPLWESYYNTLFDLALARTQALAKGDSVLSGASMVLSTQLFQQVVDMWGDIPYSQAFQNNVTRTPKYDKAPDIYAALQKVLDTAIIYFHATPTSSFSATDVVNHGDLTKWIKFANTLKLRLLIRQSEVSGFNPSDEIAKILSNGGVLHAGETVSVNPGYKNTGNQQNPYFASWGYTPSGNDAIPGQRANQYIVTILQSSNDPRLQRFFIPPASGGSNIVGTVYGLATGNPTGAQASKAGPGLVGTYPQGASQDQWIIPSFESMFFEAEAIARGWMPGDAQTAYMNAVTESFVWLGVPDAANAASNYMTNSANADWSNAGSTPLSQAKFIATQKYIALTGIDPLEAWSDIRRLGILPDKGYISVNPAKLSSSLPNRLPYSQSELTTNTANVNAEGNLNAFNFKMFWQP